MSGHQIKFQLNHIKKKSKSKKNQNQNQKDLLKPIKSKIFSIK